jgi:hypothetical protein
MNNVIVGELICALWDNWQMQQQTRINTISEHTEDHQKTKVFDDHNSSNLSISVPSKAPTSSIHDDRYVLLSPRS